MNKRIILAIVCLVTLQVSADDIVTIKDFSIPAGRMKTLNIELESDVAYAGFQFDLYLPEGVTLLEYSADKKRMPESITLTMNKQRDGSYRFLAAAMNLKEIEGTSGSIIIIKVKAEEWLPNGTLMGYFREVKLSRADATGPTYEVMPFPIAIVPPSMVTAKNYERVYGEDNPLFEFDVEGDALNGTPEITCEATVTSPAGTYDIIISKGSVSNSNVGYVSGTLTITKAPLSVKVGTYTRKQGEENPDFALSFEGFKNNETENVLITMPSASTTATKESDPGEYEVTITGGDANNYELLYYNGKLIVTEADPIVITAKDYIREYGEANPCFEYTVEGAALNGEPEIICEATATSPVGEYPIIINKGSATNYNDTYINGTLTITKAPLTISAGTYTKMQGDPMPEFSLTYDGFKNDETEDVLTTQPIVSCEADEDSAPGEYLVNVSEAQAQNYVISYVEGKLIVTERPSYTLMYLVDGMPYKTVSIKERDAITPEVEPTKEGYTFSGWSEIPETMPAHDVTVTGSFTINTYKLMYELDGKEYKTYEIEYGSVITPENEPTKEGYTFSGWSEIPESMPAHDVTVKGTFIVNTYKLMYELDGNEYKTYEIEYGSVITPENEPTKEGYTFSGWSEIPETMPAHDVTVTGSFTINTYKLTYFLDEEVFLFYEVEYGAAITPENEPTKEGYTFSGWSNIPETMPAHDVRVIGYFTINSYVLTYMIDDVVYKVVEYEYGETIKPEEQPEGDYIRFEWVDVPETMPAHDVTVYADYETGIGRIFSDERAERYYRMDGTETESLSKGFHIVVSKNADGTSTFRKVFVR